MTSEASPQSLSAAHDKKAAAGNSVFAALFLTSMKLVVGILTGSLGILAEAAHSGLDLVAAFITFLAVRVSDKPADHDHTYGHGKIENFSALVETVLLFVTCAWIIYEAVRRIGFQTIEIDPSLWAFLVMVISIGVDVSRSRMLYRAARKHHSQALEADALHFSTDVWSSSVVIGGLLLVWLGKHVFHRQAELLQKADAVSALGVAFIVLFISYKLGKRTVDVLLDRAPDGLAQKISEAAGAIEGVLSVGQVRLRRSGPSVFVDMAVDVDRNLSFERTHAIAESVEACVQSVAPGADVVIHTDPREVERETKAKRIRAIAYRDQMSVHNISLHEDRDRVLVDLHLEVDDHLSLQQAHDLATHIEKDLRDDMPEITQINTHIESRGTGIGEGVDVTSRESALVDKVKKLTNKVAGASRCHNVMVRRHADNYSVSLHCHFEKQLSIIQVHDVSTRIEERLKERIPGLVRVLVHAEPESR
ncbi:MAG: cation-efflux pump [Candidatus Aminicenantes bacterium]|nr:cation-efflux pump [Candidatus Aminicenantes bacterium]